MRRRRARCSADWRRQPSSAATTISTAGTGPTPGEHVVDEPLVAGHVDKRDLGTRRQQSSRRTRGRSSCPAGAPRPSGRAPCRSAPGPASTCRDRRAPRSRSRAPVAASRTATASSSSRSAGTQRRSSRQRSRSRRPTHARLALRSASANATGIATAQPASVRPGAPPPPTAPPLGTAGSPRTRDRRARRPRPQPGGVGVQRLVGRCRGPSQRRLDRGEGQLVDPERRGRAGAGAGASTRSALEAAPRISPACGPPSSLSPLAVTRSAPPVSAVGGVRLRRAAAGRGEQAGTDVDDDRRARQRARQLGERRRRRRGEARTHEVRGMHLEDGTRCPGRRVGVVAQGDPVGRADLADPGSGRDDQVGQSEPVADLDQLAAAHETSRPAASAVTTRTSAAAPLLTNEGVARVGDGAQQHVECTPTAGGPRPGCEVELDVDVTGRVLSASRAAGDSGARPRLVCSTTPVALITGQRLAERGGSARAVVGDVLGRDLAVPDALLRAADGLLDQRTAQPGDGQGDLGLGEHGVGAGHPAPGIGREGHGTRVRRPARHGAATVRVQMRSDPGAPNGFRCVYCTQSHFRYVVVGPARRLQRSERGVRSHSDAQHALPAAPAKPGFSLLTMSGTDGNAAEPRCGVSPRRDQCPSSAVTSAISKVVRYGPKLTWLFTA